MHATHTHRHTNCTTKQETDLLSGRLGMAGTNGEEWEGLWEGRVGSGRYRPNPEVLHYKVMEKLSPCLHS